MDNVIVINEECHGFIGVARDVPSAIDFLWTHDWLNGYTEILVDHEWDTVQNVFGEEWRERFELLTLDELQDILDGCFYFQKEKLW